MCACTLWAGWGLFAMHYVAVSCANAKCATSDVSPIPRVEVFGPHRLSDRGVSPEDDWGGGKSV